MRRVRSVLLIAGLVLVLTACAAGASSVTTMRGARPAS